MIAPVPRNLKGELRTPDPKVGRADPLKHASGFFAKRIEKVDIDQIRREVQPFVKAAAALAIWSKE